jgi:hypothetical protein
VEHDDLVEAVITQAQQKISARARSQVSDDGWDAVRQWAKDHATWIQAKRQDGWSEAKFANILLERLRSDNTTPLQTRADLGVSDALAPQPPPIAGNRVQVALSLCPDNC